MKIKGGFILGNVEDSYVVVPLGKEVADFSGMITLNDTGAFLWNQLQQECTKEELVKAMLQEYDVPQERALKGVEKFLDQLEENHFLEE